MYKELHPHACTKYYVHYPFMSVLRKNIIMVLFILCAGMCMQASQDAGFFWLHNVIVGLCVCLIFKTREMTIGINRLQLLFNHLKLTESELNALGGRSGHQQQLFANTADFLLFTLGLP